MSWQDQVRRAAISIFEDAAFCFVEEVEASAEVEGACSVVCFDGPSIGSLWVTVDDAALPALAADMLGVEEPPSEALQHDALREIANMICGRLVSGLGQRSGLFRLRAAAPERAPAGPPTAQAVLALGPGRSRVALWVGPEADAAS